MPWEIIPGVQAFEGEEITKMKYNEKEYWLKPFIPKLGKTITSGKGKVGKTTLILEMCFAIARDEPWLNYEVEHCKILYIPFEPIRHKVGNLLKVRPGPLDGFTVVPMLGHYMPIDPKPRSKPKTDGEPEPTGYELLDGMIERKQPNMVVLDPLRHTIQGDIKDDQQCGEWAKRLDSLQDKYRTLDLSFVIIGHEPKRGLRNPVDRPFGSMVLGAWADVLASVTRGKAKDRRIVELVSRHEEEPEPLELEFHGSYILAPEKGEEGEKKARAKELLRELRASEPDLNATIMIHRVAAKGISVSWVWDAWSELKTEEDQQFFDHAFDETKEAGCSSGGGVSSSSSRVV